MLRFELMVAWRFLNSARRQTLLILAGIIFGVGVQIFLGSLITGLQENLIEQTVGSSSHITVFRETENPSPMLPAADGEKISVRNLYAPEEEKIIYWETLFETMRSSEDFTAVSPVLSGPAFLNKGLLEKTVRITGIIPEEADRMLNLKERTVEGEAFPSGNGILLGRDLAEELDVETGDSLLFTTGEGTSNYFRAAGIFDFENAAVNSSVIYMDLYRSQKFLDSAGRISRFELQINDIFATDRETEKIRKRFPGFTVKTWQEENQSLLQALQSQSSSSYIIQIFVMLAVVLGIASILIISAVQKQKQIGILKAMGASGKTAANIFLIQGAILGLAGSLLGALFGIFLVELFYLASTSGGGGPTFTIGIYPNLIVTAVAVTTVFSIIAAVLPARTAGKLKPIEVIRNG